MAINDKQIRGRTCCFFLGLEYNPWQAPNSVLRSKSHRNMMTALLQWLLSSIHSNGRLPFYYYF
jgi:hypothetical protein